MQFYEENDHKKPRPVNANKKTEGWSERSESRKDNDRDGHRHVHSHVHVRC